MLTGSLQMCEQMAREFLGSLVLVEWEGGRGAGVVGRSGSSSAQLRVRHSTAS